MSRSKTTAETAAHRTLAVLVEPTAGKADVCVFGLSARERLERTFATLGLLTLTGGEVHDDGDPRTVALCGDHFYDERLVSALAGRSDDLLLVIDEPGRGRVAVGLAASMSKVEALISGLGSDHTTDEQAAAAQVQVVSVTDLVPAYDAKLRKHAPAFVLPVHPDLAREAEVRIFDASYKGITDFVTKWVWPLPARIVTGWCARRGITPNMVTALSYLMAFVTLVAFWRGEFGAGLLSAWVMTFLDTVDGKLARVTLTSTKLGDFLDHGLDLIHPPLWWAAWGAGLVGPGELFGSFAPWVAVVVFGYIVGRLLEGLFILAFGQEMFTWRPFDFAFRLVIARRNPNLVLLSGATLIGRPDLGLIALAIWTATCILVQCVRIAQAAALRLRGQAIRPYADVAETPDATHARESA